MKKPSRKALEKQCFALIQQIALIQDPHCIHCGLLSEAGHHVLGRGLAVAFHPECVRGVCNTCHTYAHLKPEAFRRWFYEVVGAWKYDGLEKLSRQVIPDMDFAAKRAELKGILADLEGRAG